MKSNRLFAVACAIIPGLASSAGIALLDAPNIVEGGLSVRPNLYFILDNSGSMDWDFLPDWVAYKPSNPPSYCKGTSGKANGDVSQGSTGSNAMFCCLTSSGTASNGDDCLGNSKYGLPPFLSPDFNNIYYSPTITYEVPRNYDGSLKEAGIVSGAAKKDGYGIQSTGTLTLSTSFPDIKWCTSADATDCLYNGNYLLPGYVNGKSYATMVATAASGTANIAKTVSSVESRSLGPHYYLIVPGAYCTTKKLTDCANQNGATTERPFPAKLRWCNTADLKTVDDPTTTSIKEGCQALKTATYAYPLYPRLVLSGSISSSSGTFSIPAIASTGSITLKDFIINDGLATQKNLFASSLTWTVSTSVYTSGICDDSSTEKRQSGFGKAIVNKINANSAVTGFSASLYEDNSNCGRFKVYGPGGVDYSGATAKIKKSDDSLVTLGTGITVASSTTMSKVANFGAAANDALYSPGTWYRVDITPAGTYGNLYVDKTTGEVTTTATANTTLLLDRSSRTDCTAGVCTYQQEIQNFANWFTWYRTRMQMMKSAVSLAFQSIDDKVRVGYFTINNPDMVSDANGINIRDFNSSQKQSWYANFFKANPSGGTPLREALGRAGRLYAGLISAVADAKDPVQYSCQKNFTILSTDGYWNGSNGVNLSGSLITTDVDGDGQSQTLSDIAAYYYQTDLRITDCLNEAANNLDGVNYDDLCRNNVPKTIDADNDFQHMVTSTIGLGIDGVMQYRSEYQQTPKPEDLPDDYSAVLAGTAANPSTGVCPWQASGACNWPIAGADKQENIDDLWHAAVNGYGTYYSARTPNELREGLEDLLAKINSSTGGAAAATTSNPNITTGDNFVFSSSFRTVEWYGDLVRQEIDTSTGQIQPSVNWSLKDKMNLAGLRSSVFTWSDTAPDHRKSFNYSPDLASSDEAVCNPTTNERGCFNTPLISAWQQWSGLTADQKTLAAKQTVINYLKGEQANEGTLFRDRTATLGDIVSAEAVYVGRYMYEYGDGYPGRGVERADPTVYAAANDGMLHAVNANTGELRWSYIPSMVLNKLYLLADKGYDLNHRFFVDGTPVVADIQVGGWKTILVGGLGGGGQGYYSLDITNQASPSVLWEFRKRPASSCVVDPGPALIDGVLWDCDLGYGFGNPVIGKVDGTWVVMVTSGYNNHTDGGDGKGYLYVLNALTGAPIRKISTGVGDITTPSGLSKISSWADNAMTDNSVQYVYGGDYLGNLWRFDVIGGGATLLKAFGSTQPITAKPELGLIAAGGLNKKVVFVPTGSLVAAGDLSTADQQSFYAIWDAGLNGKSPSNLVEKGMAGGSGSQKTSVTCDSVFEDNENIGWRLDFSVMKERGTTDPTLAFGTLVFSTNAPTSTSVCNPSGFESWVYNVDYKCGGVVNDGTNNNVLAVQYEGAATRPNVIVLPSGVVKSITRVSGQSLDNKVGDVRVSSSGGGQRRISWRELFD